MGQAKRRGTYEQRRDVAERKKSDRLHALIMDAEQSRIGRRPEINMIDAILEAAFVGSLKPRHDTPIPPPILIVDDEHHARGMRALLPQEVEVITFSDAVKGRKGHDV